MKVLLDGAEAPLTRKGDSVVVFEVKAQKAYTVLPYSARANRGTGESGGRAGKSILRRRSSGKVALTLAERFERSTRIELFNASGKLVAAGDIFGSQADFPEPPIGVYWYRIRNNTQGAAKAAFGAVVIVR